MHKQHFTVLKVSVFIYVQVECSWLMLFAVETLEMFLPDNHVLYKWNICDRILENLPSTHK